jgi:hypothetical protein
MKLSMQSVMGLTLGASLALGLSSCSEDLQTATYSYSFNTGALGAGTEYNGTHPDNLTASMTVTELEEGGSEISVTLTNTLDGETYMLHAHDAADPASTPNGTPYNETPNSDVFVQMLTGNGASATATQTTTLSYEEITTTYAGFFVVHDPTQAISTTDLQTYLIVGDFARN